MKCPKCNQALPEASKFCPQCGARVADEQKTIQLKCKVCGGTLRVDAGRTMLVCPFCQSAELLEESDSVTIQWIKSDAYRDVEMAKLRTEEARELRKDKQAKEAEKKSEATKKAYDGKFGKLAVVCAVFAVICAVRAFSAFRNMGQPLVGIISAAQAVVFGSAWLFGRKNSHGRTQTKHKLLAIAGFLLLSLNSLAAPDATSSFPASPSFDVKIPSISEDSVTDKKEGIYCYPIRNYVGRNAATIGNSNIYYRVDEYGKADLRIAFVTTEGLYIDPLNTEQLKNYIVYAQSLPTTNTLTAVADRFSNGEISSFIDYQNHEEIVLYVYPVGSEAPEVPVITAIAPSTDRRTYYVRDYVGRNAASIGPKSRNRRMDEYGHGEVKVLFSTADGTYIEANDIDTLRQYVVVAQDIAPNTQITYTFDTLSGGEETSFVDYQNYTEINLTVVKLDDATIALMPEITPTPEPEPTPVVMKLKLDWEVRNGHTVITGYSGTGNAVTIPSKLGGYEVTEIGNDAFKNCTTLEHLDIDADLVRIGNSAFEGCTALTKISLPLETEDIGNSAFRNCTALTDVIIWGDPDFGAYSFAGCTALDSISIPNDTKTIGAHAFEGCTALKNVTFWGGEVIEEYAFADCTSIDDISLPYNMKRVKAHAFDGCTVLSSLMIWNDDTVIDRMAFTNCPNLNSEYAIPATITTETVNPTSTAAPTSTPTANPTKAPTQTPAKTPVSTPTPKPIPTATPYSSIYDIALVRKLNSYSLYYLIDLDGKTARFFGTNNDTSVQVGKVSGNLSSGLKITYTYGGDTWTEMLKYSNSSKTSVTLIDANGFDWAYSVADVATVEKILQTPGYHDMK